MLLYSIGQQLFDGFTIKKVALEWIYFEQAKIHYKAYVVNMFLCIQARNLSSWMVPDNIRSETLICHGNVFGESSGFIYYGVIKRCIYAKVIIYNFFMNCKTSQIQHFKFQSPGKSSVCERFVMETLNSVFKLVHLQT